MDSESICLWIPCTHRGSFDTSAALLAHIYDAHRSSCTRKHRLACKWSHCDATVMCPGPGESMCDVKVHMLQHTENRAEQEEALTSKVFQERMNGRRGRRRTDTSLPIPTSPTTTTAGPSSPVPPLRTSSDAVARETSSAQVAESSPRHGHAHGAGGLPSPSLSPTSTSPPALPTPTPQTQPSLSCKWSTCTSPAFPNAAHLLAHVLTSHVRDRARNEWVTKPTQTGGRSTTYRRVMCCWKGTDCAKMVSVKGTYAAHFKAHILALVKETDPDVDVEALMVQMSARGAAVYPIPKERPSPKRSKRAREDLDPAASEKPKRPRVEGQQSVLKLEDPTATNSPNPPTSPSSPEEEEDDLDWSLS
ncbi:hypothetical protein EXIGLDRAFT_840155 [Exidia glandulosa HHB12029]|uniref:Uncharacterized protein n=1 Tax=Exidia glandulosa HHB12029 TaxID=1314781 RepID=A0A165ELL9_EXIGL|nr:hypothetical protein EXIGLDRAFT_840155 [Exidia glandulosa HHB12029]